MGNKLSSESFKMRYTKDKIKSLDQSEIIVFASNLAGKHHVKSVIPEALQFGALPGKGIGLQGNTYAIPTTCADLKSKVPLTIIRNHIAVFVDFAELNPHLKFYVTKLGCGCAGASRYDIHQIAPLFVDAVTVENIFMPKEFFDIVIAAFY